MTHFLNIGDRIILRTSEVVISFSGEMATPFSRKAVTPILMRSGYRVLRGNGYPHSQMASSLQLKPHTDSGEVAFPFSGGLTST